MMAPRFYPAKRETKTKGDFVPQSKKFQFLIPHFYNYITRFNLVNFFLQKQKGVNQINDSPP
ncbi:hypothetical protein A2Y83_02385 [Candidatus Falkowbacteria bacterium RBG_13_39_14]|uniref:Uncharacterized protein n=1 Tax=Candidatus Falkowbacteria bacterium RBG_13_39_14 TaxID=1797985 RepID=A0A1F5S558_9BACT|nr:MAG: hypothetical protein A2Y83_02385 [Candidatus Falkowbacteria bacterium RBG_13_39_14]